MYLKMTSCEIKIEILKEENFSGPCVNTKSFSEQNHSAQWSNNFSCEYIVDFYKNSIPLFFVQKNEIFTTFNIQKAFII